MVSILALLVMSIAGCLIFISIIEIASHTPLNVTVTSHAIRIDDGSEQEVVRICDLIEIQRSQTIFSDEIVLKATADREFSLENLVDGDQFLKTVIENARSLNAKGKPNTRLASFTVVTSSNDSKIHETIGRPKFGHEASSLQVTNKLTAFLLTLPVPAAITACVFSALLVIALSTYGETHFSMYLLLLGLLIAFGSYVVTCYALFVEKQVFLTSDEVVIETSSERIALTASSIGRVWLSRGGVTSVVFIESELHGIIELRGFVDPRNLQRAVHWVATGERDTSMGLR